MQNTERLKVVSFLSIEDEAADLFKQHPNIDFKIVSVFLKKEEILKEAAGCVAVIVSILFPINKEFMDAAGPQLKIISTFASGYENIDIKECAARGIKVGFTDDLGSDLIAEYAIGLLLNSSRRISEAIIATRGKGWSFFDRKNDNTLEWFTGRSLIQSTVGIFGLGKIGFEIVKRLRGFNAKKIIYYNRKPNPKADELGCQYVSFERLLTDSDFLICSSSANPQNQGIFNIDAFKQMKPTSIFINVSRGSMVNTDDLYDVLSNRIILGAGLDVTQPEPLPANHKLHTLDNCMITPHMAWSEKNLNIAKSICVVNNVLWVLDGTDSHRGVYVNI